MTQYHLLALAAGLVLPIQIAFNNRLTQFTGNPVISSFLSFIVGAVILLTYNITTQAGMVRSIQLTGAAPWYAWLGGLMGAFYVVTTLIVSPRIGIAMSLSLVIGGQLFMSLLVDHYGWIGVPIKPFTWIKGLGAALVVAGILLMKK